MFNIIYHIIFLFLSLYLTVKSSIYGIYEIKNKNNTAGGISVILLNIFCFIFTNAAVWLHL